MVIYTLNMEYLRKDSKIECQNYRKCDKAMQEMENKYIFAGPLNLNKMQKEASTVMGSDIVLGQNDFDALYLLATNEDRHISFQQIYEASWGRDKETDCLDYASKALENLIQQINRAGDDFMWIDYTSGLGYRFKTRWGRKWNKKD